MNPESYAYPRSMEVFLQKFKEKAEMGSEAFYYRAACLSVRKSQRGLSFDSSAAFTAGHSESITLK